MPRFKLSQETVVARFLAAGYVVLGDYVRKDVPILARCERHNFQGPVTPNNIFQGGRMQCCGKESMAAKLSARLTGEGNHFYGKKHSTITREILSKQKQLNPPKHRPPVNARKGCPRSESTKAKLRAFMQERHKVFSYCTRKARSGKTSGKEGIFYVVRIGDLLKFGSATTTMSYRLSRLRAKHGSVELLAYCIVADAGEYEALAMERCREHWSHGEYFHDWLRGAASLS